MANMVGLELPDLLANPDTYSEKYGASYGTLLEQLDALTKQFIWTVIGGLPVSHETVFSHKFSADESKELDLVRDRILRINRGIEDSREIDSLLIGFDGRYIPAGPSGLISRGREDVLPTGRNFYSLDPYRVPTQAAWRIGQRLTDALLEKYTRDKGTIPENVAFYWMAGDIMSSDGEMYAELLWLLGVEPVWQSNGQVKSFKIVPLEQLGRPRVDITVRTSGILRDNFSNCYELVDQAVQSVAALDEPDEQNFVRKHCEGCDGCGWHRIPGSHVPDIFIKAKDLRKRCQPCSPCQCLEDGGRSCGYLHRLEWVCLWQRRAGGHRP